MTALGAWLIVTRPFFADGHSMGFALRAGVSFCKTSGRLLFLDLANDRYFALSEEAELIFERLVAGSSLDPSENSVLSGLVSSGLLTVCDDQERPFPCPTPSTPERSLLDEVQPVSSGAVLSALARLTRSAFALKTRPLISAIRALEQRKAALPQSSSTGENARLVETAAAFNRSTLLASPLDQCLPRSLAAAHRLLDLGIRGDLVIGVRVRPFAAHCWVQCGVLLVNERIEQVRNYTPILTV